MAQVVYKGVDGDSGITGSLFQGTKFWLSHRVPSRSGFIEMVKANGGEVVSLEKLADIKIVDHLKQDAIPGTHSFQYIERSVRNGVLENLDDHQAGPKQRSARPAGAIGQSAKGTRVPFSAEDDRVLCDWVLGNQKKGGFTAGNEIYKQLWENNPRHTWQSWRDRWVKYVKYSARAMQIEGDAPPTPPTEEPEIATTHVAAAPVMEAARVPFTAEDAQALLQVAEDILEILPESRTAAWEKWADTYSHHSAHEWRNFWEANIRPVYMKKIKTQEALQKEKPNVSVSHDAVAEHQLEKTTSNKTESSTMTSSVTPAHEQYGRVISEDVNPVQAMPDATGQTLPGDAAITELVESKGFMKRKRSMTDDTSLTSSLLDPRDTPPPKRIRADNGAMRVREIPSTPDRSPLQTRRAPLTPIKNEVIESPEDGFSGAKEEDHDNDMVLVEVRYVNMESEEEQEVEEDDEDETQESDDPFLPGRPASQSLSEPEPAFPKGKSTLRDSGEMLDLDVPSPEGGWDEDEAPAQPIPDSDLENPESNTLRPDTQALLQNTVPAYDFTVPEPDEGWDAFLPAPPSSPPIPLSSPEAAASPPVILMPEKEMLAQLEAWMDAHVESGIAIEVVGFALKCTNNEPDLADLVLASLRNGHGVPEDIRGVWTQSDDEGLEAVDARLVRAVIAKHGREGLDARYEFLKVYNEA